MPNISAHMIVANEVGKKINILSDDYFRGNLLPDIIDDIDSHHRIEKKSYFIPDIDYFVKKLDLSQDLYIGYLIHLLLDKHYLSDYICKLYPEANIFIGKEVYQDYDYLNHALVERFNLDTKKLEKVLSNYDNCNCKILKEKLKYNIEFLKQNIEGKTKYIDFNEFSLFLSNVSNDIYKELIDYGNKSSQLRLRIGQRKK